MNTAAHLQSSPEQVSAGDAWAGTRRVLRRTDPRVRQRQRAHTCGTDSMGAGARVSGWRSLAVRREQQALGISDVETRTEALCRLGLQVKPAD
jgi:hypothetical protein